MASKITQTTFKPLDTNLCVEYTEVTMQYLLRISFTIYLLCISLIVTAFVVAIALPNTMLAFSNCERGGEVYVADWIRGLSFDISKDPNSFDWRPTWSPNGEQLAFQADEDTKHMIYVTDVTRTFTHILTNRYKRLKSPAWSPDGNHIAYIASTDTGVSPLFVVNLATNAVIEFPVATSNSLSTSPAWSPFSDSIALMDFTQHQPEILILNVATGETRNISNNFAAADTDPIWSPDGKHLVFTSTRDAIHQLYLFNFETGVLSNLSNNTAIRYSGGAWSPDGQSIAGIADGQKVQIFNTSGQIAQTIELPQIPRPIYAVNWSPDGSHFAVAAGDDPNQGDYLVEISTRKISTLSYPACDFLPATWASQ
jgi:Tol biopolymer transport system component